MNRSSRVFCNKKGFTLTELTIVLVLLGLIALLATTIILSVNSSQNNAQLNSKQERDILELEKSLNEWFYVSDNSQTAISVYDDKLLTDNGSCYSFTNGELTFTNHNDSIRFSEITSITFDVPYANVISIRAQFRNSDAHFFTIVTVTAATVIKGENNE